MDNSSDHSEEHVMWMEKIQTIIVLKCDKKISKHAKNDSFTREFDYNTTNFYVFITAPIPSLIDGEKLISAILLLIETRLKWISFVQFTLPGFHILILSQVQLRAGVAPICIYDFITLIFPIFLMCT